MGDMYSLIKLPYLLTFCTYFQSPYFLFRTKSGVLSYVLGMFTLEIYAKF